MDLILAALLATAPAVDATGRAQLLPAGEFAARDGRPGNGLKWRIDDAQGMRLAADINGVAAQTPIVIDYEHQTLNAERNGQAAPAAGWIRSVEWVAGRGLFATVEWTDKARAHIAANEYRYISPVIAWDKTTGRVVGLHNAALVNHPALLGMDSVSAALAARFPSQPSQTRTETHHMDRTKLITALKLPATATDADIETAIAQLGTDLTTARNEATTLRTQAEALKGQETTAQAAMAALQAQVTALSTAAAQRELDALVTGALQAGKLLPAQKDWAMGLGGKDIASLRAYIASAHVIPLAGQTGGREPGGTAQSDDSKSIAKRAQAYQAEQLKAGIEVTTVQAVEAVLASTAK